MPRALWSGFLKLSLVSCPIALYSAIAAPERLSFRQINKNTGNRLRQQLIDTVTGEPVHAKDKGRGYEIGEDEYLLVQDEELAAAEEEARSRPFSGSLGTPSVQQETDGAAERPRDAPTRSYGAVRDSSVRTEKGRNIETPQLEPPSDVERRALPPPVRIENNRTIEIDRFIPCEELDAAYFDTPYYVAPRDEVGQEAFAVIREAMRRKDVVGMGRVVLTRRERPIILEPLGEGIRGITLRYAHEVRGEQEYFVDIPRMVLPKEMLNVAEHIVETKISDFDRAFLEDRYRTVMIEKLKEKRRDARPKTVAVAPSTQNVINLMDVLKKSLAVERPAARPSVTKPTHRRRSSLSSRGAASKRSKKLVR